MCLVCLLGRIRVGVSLTQVNKHPVASMLPSVVESPCCQDRPQGASNCMRTSFKPSWTLRCFRCFRLVSNQEPGDWSERHPQSDEAIPQGCWKTTTSRLESWALRPGTGNQLASYLQVIPNGDPPGYVAPSFLEELSFGRTPCGVPCLFFREVATIWVSFKAHAQSAPPNNSRCPQAK